MLRFLYSRFRAFGSPIKTGKSHLVVGELHQLILRPSVLEAMAALHLIPREHPVTRDCKAHDHARHLLVLALPQKLLPPQVVHLSKRVVIGMEARKFTSNQPQADESLKRTSIRRSNARVVVKPPCSFVKRWSKPPAHRLDLGDPQVAHRISGCVQRHS